MSKPATAAEIKDILYGVESRYGYLFPYRRKVPTVSRHPFDALRSGGLRVDELAVRTMINLDYIGWTAKVVLGLDLFPSQIAILQTIWKKPFPMLVATRGGGKCVRGDTLCRTSEGLLRIDEIVPPQAPPLSPLPVTCDMQGENGFNRPSYGWNNGVSKTKKITLRSGIQLEATLNHPIRCVAASGHLAWKMAGDIAPGDLVPIDRSQYAFGTDPTTSEAMGWWLGAMIGDGTLTQRAMMIFTSFDDDIAAHFIDVTRSELNYDVKHTRAGTYRIHSVAIWDRLNRLYNIGGRDSYTKTIPPLVRRSPRNVVAAFLRGLFDTDASVCSDRPSIEYCTCSEELARGVQQLLLGFGIVSSNRPRVTRDQRGTAVTSWRLMIHGVANLTLFAEHIGFVCQRKEDRLRAQCQKRGNPNIDVIRGIEPVVLKLRDKFNAVCPARRGAGTRFSSRELLTPTKLRTYRVTYQQLGRLLADTSMLADNPDWQFLSAIHRKHYFFDEVVAIEDSECQSFDVHIPDDHSFISNGLISHNSFLLAVYAVLRALLEPGTKIVIIGAGLRQAKLVFAYIEDIWHRSPVLRSIIGGGRKAGPKQTVDQCYFRVGESVILALPLGDGSKIRGFRANVVVADEFASIPEDVFDIVVRGFTAVSKSPVDEARRLTLEKKLDEVDCPAHIRKQIFSERNTGNQIIYSGTAYYAFNHFAKRFDMWRSIIASRGDPLQVAEIFGGENNVPDQFDWKDYVVIRLPYTHVQAGLLDRRQLAHAKAMLPNNIFLMEYGACFVKDSDGFFPRSLIESCTTSPSRPILTPDGDVAFTPMVRGEKGRRYVIGIDPAAERDNLAVTVIEVWNNHYRVVYCWTCRKPEFEKRKKRGLVTDDDYYAYCCSKIRDVIRLFAPIRVEMDSQGGGYAISEMLRNKKLVNKEKGQFPIYEVIDYDDPKPTDHETDGPHVLHLVTQTTEFNSQSNLFLHKSFETKRLLFPAFDTVKMQAALAAEKSLGIVIDTYEDVVTDIEQLKDELCNIQMVQTTTGKERFQTPNISEATQGGEGKKRSRRLRKDRYTSLLLAHRYIYDSETTPETAIDYDDVAGNIEKTEIDPTEGMYRGPGVGQMRNAGWAHELGVGAVKRGEKVY